MYLGSRNECTPCCEGISPVRNVARVGEQTGLLHRARVKRMPSRRQPVDVRRADVRVAIAAERPGALVVGEDEDEVRRSWRRLRSWRWVSSQRRPPAQGGDQRARPWQPGFWNSSCTSPWHAKGDGAAGPLPSAARSLHGADAPAPRPPRVRLSAAGRAKSTIHQVAAREYHLDDGLDVRSAVAGKNGFTGLGRGMYA